MKNGKAIGLIAALAACGFVPCASAADADIATAEEAVNNVRAAAKFLHDKGSAGYAEFNNKDGKWVWKDSYVFVYDCRRKQNDGTPLAARSGRPADHADHRQCGQVHLQGTLQGR